MQSKKSKLPPIGTLLYCDFWRFGENNSKIPTFLIITGYTEPYVNFVIQISNQTGSLAHSVINNKELGRTFYLTTVPGTSDD